MGLALISSVVWRSETTSLSTPSLDSARHVGFQILQLLVTRVWTEHVDHQDFHRTEEHSLLSPQPVEDQPGRPMDQFRSFKDVVASLVLHAYKQRQDVAICCALARRRDEHTTSCREQLSQCSGKWNAERWFVREANDSRQDSRQFAYLD